MNIGTAIKLLIKGRNKENPISPNEFEGIMRMIKEGYEDDPECCHIYMDEFMCVTLMCLGYDNGVEVFDSSTKWYS